MSLRHCAHSLLLVAFFGLSFTANTSAQVTQLSDATAPPTPGVGHNYIGILNEIVNPTTGALTIHIDAPIAPGRKLTIPFGFEYNSGQAWFLSKRSTPSASCNPNSCPPPAGYVIPSSALDMLTAGGWSASFPKITYMIGMQTINNTANIPPGFPDTICKYNAAFMFTDPLGMQHQLNLSHITSTPPSGSSVTACYYTKPQVTEIDNAFDFYVQA